jgi:hypothetical protein
MNIYPRQEVEGYIIMIQKNLNSEESKDENSGFSHEFDPFGDGHRGYGDGRHADFDNPCGRCRAHGR